jgi:hypothetical protein
LAFHVEVDLSGFPIVAGFGQEGGDQAEEGWFVGENAGDTGAAFEFLVDPFQRFAGAHFLLVGAGQGENREALREVFFQPRGEFGGTVGVVGDDFLEALFGGGATGAVKDAADVPRHFRALIQSGNISLGVLLEMELTALPGDRENHSPVPHVAVASPGSFTFRSEETEPAPHGLLFRVGHGVRSLFPLLEGED